MGKRLLSLLVVCLCAASMAFAQKNVTGVVVDAATGEPVIGASVIVPGTTIGAATDLNGRFTISNVPASAKTVRASYIGMETIDVAIKSNMTINMVSSDKSLNEIMVVAYGTAKKSAYTGSASVMKAEKIESRQVSNISNALSGTMAGVQTQSSNGQPGTSSTVRIRGIGSMSASNSPLYVLDGLPFEGDLSSINSQDIESMTVLKDAAAAALYGARGANGVILITTKKGSNSKAKITVDAKWGANNRQVGKYDVMDSPAQYYETLYKAYKNNGVYDLGYSEAAAHAYANKSLFPATGYQIYTLPEGEGLIGMDGKLNPNAKLGYSDGEFYYTPDDWEKETLRTGFRQEYNMTLSGGSQDLNYYFSANYLEDTGIIENSGFNRFNTRMNVEYQAKKWLKLGTNMSFTYADSRYPDEQTTDASNSSGNSFLMVNNLAPIYPMYVRNADGTMKHDAYSGNPIYDYGNPAMPGCTNAVRNWMSNSNPKGDLIYNDEGYLMDIFNGKWYAEVSPIKDLKLTASFGLFTDNTRNNLVNNQFYGQSSNYGGEAAQVHSRTSALNQQYLGTYRFELGANNFDLLAGYESYEWHYDRSEAYGQNLYKAGDYHVYNTIDQRIGSGAGDRYSTRGIFGRVNYNYNEKYFASVSYRRDASSRFHPDKRWGNFYSVSAAWNLKGENFMESVDWVDMLKLRASFGQQGNDNIGNYYAYLDQYTVTGANGVFSDGKLSYKGNPDITWEKSNAFNVGVDFSLWQGRLDGTVEYFSRRTSDMLYNKPVAASNGYSSIPMNIGSVTNSGLEVELNGVAYRAKDVEWSLYGNITMIKNKINELHPDLKGELISGTRIFREGESMYQLYLPQYAGVDPATGLALYKAKRDIEDEDGNPIGEEEYLTSDRDVANNTNRKASGCLLPVGYGGFGTTLKAYGFDLTIGLAYQFGGKIWDYTYQDLMHCGKADRIGTNWHKDIANAWTPDNPYTDVPRLSATDKFANSNSDRWLVSSNYLALHNITLGYNIPTRVLSSVGLYGLRLYVTGENLALLTARKGLDPRQGYVASEGATYGALRSVSAGLKVTF